MTHDDKRNGTTTLFAALDVLTGTVIGQCLPRHRHAEFLTFLKTIDGQVPKRLKVHLILDNYATHDHPKVRAWLARHPRFELHFTPTSSSWLNMVELCFGKLTDKAIRRGIFRSVPDLIAAIETYLAAHNIRERRASADRARKRPAPCPVEHVAKPVLCEAFGDVAVRWPPSPRPRWSDLLLDLSAVRAAGTWRTRPDREIGRS